VLADRAQCYAQPGYDGVSGVGTPVGLGVFAPMSPTARITQAANVIHGTAHTFSGATSTDPFPGGSPTTYRWTWGDGTSFTTQNATAAHTYAHAGTVTVTLKVTDNYGRSNTVTKQVTVQ
jgi:PKD repeat protein